MAVFLSCYTGSARTDDNLFLELIINERNTGDVVEAVQDGDSWKIAYADFRKLNLNVEIPATDFVTLNSIADIGVTYDAQLQQLWLMIPSHLLPVQRMRLRTGLATDVKATRDKGLFVNYDVFGIFGHKDQTRQSSLWHGANFFSDHYYIVSNGIFQNNSGAFADSGYTRFDSYFQQENETRLRSWTLGDVINATPNWGRSIRMGGFRMARDYDLDPSLITYPVPEFYGESAVPSSIDLLINNQLRWRDKVAPGPFLIDTLPYISGAGVAEIITTNMQGQKTQNSVNFYVTSQLLAKGNLDYDFTAGFRRLNFGRYSNSYADTPSASYSLRYGWNDTLTPQLLLQQGEGLALAGLGTTFVAGSLGVFEVTHSYSDWHEAQGQQSSFAYNYNYKNVGVNTRYLRRFDQYRDLGNLDGTVPNTTETQLSFSFHQSLVGTMNVGYFHLENIQAEQLGLLNCSWNRYFNSGIAAFLNINRQLDRGRANTVSLSFSIPLGGNADVSATAYRNIGGQWSHQLQTMHNPPYSGGLGWNLGADTSELDNRYAIAEWRGRYAEVAAGFYSNDNRQQYTGDVNGALILMDGDIYASHFVNDAFALVDSGREDIPVLSANQWVGNTNAEGKLLVPDLYSYLENHLSIDATELPANVSVAAIEQVVVPRRRGGVHVEFPVNFLQSALIIVLLANEETIPPGSILKNNKTGETFLMGWGGEVYIESLVKPLTLFWAEGNCVVEVLPPENNATAIPRLGPFYCRAVTPQ